MREEVVESVDGRRETPVRTDDGSNAQRPAPIAVPNAPAHSAALSSITPNSVAPSSIEFMAREALVHGTFRRAETTGATGLNEPAPASGAADSAPMDPDSSETLSMAVVDPELIELWSALEGEIRKRVKHEQFATWFRRIALRDVDAENVRLVVHNSFAKDWLEANYRPALEQSVAALFGGPRGVVIEVDPELGAGREPRSASAAEGLALEPGQGGGGSSLKETTATTEPRTGFAERSRSARDAAPHHNGLAWESDVALNPNYRFDNFVVGPCNRFAHAAAVGVSESPGRSYNPFFLHGSVGLGKTHLLQSLCYALLDETPDTRILYLSCETFVNHFIAALGSGNLGKFRNKYRNVDVLVVDDIHLLANKERTQEEFFHTFNSLYNAGKQIVLSSDSSPKEIPTLQERLVSRFKWGLVTEIEQPCYETRMAILKRKSRERGYELPDAVAQLVAEYVDNNIRELEGAVNRLIGFANLNGQELNADLARKVLRDVLSAPRGQPAMEDILRIITAHYNIKLTDLQSRRRTKAIAFPRQVGMYLARKITRHSLEEIGGFFGGRDHTTVLYAVEQIEKGMRADERLRASVASFLSQLER